MTVALTSLHGISEKNRRMLTVLHRATTGPFTPQEAATALDLDLDRVHRFLPYLAQRGWLTRVRRGLYATVPLEADEPTRLREDPWVVASRVFSPAYIGGWTACEHWGFTEQIFRETVVISSRRVRDRHMEIQGFPFRIKVVNKDKMFGTRVVWRDQTRVLVSDPSRTIVDILDDPGIGGGIRHVADVLVSYLSMEHRDDALLIDYARKLGNRTVFKRLGYLVEVLGAENEVLLEACKKSVSSGISMLDPTGAGMGRITRRWNLKINAAVRRQGESL